MNIAQAPVVAIPAPVVNSNLADAIAVNSATAYAPIELSDKKEYLEIVTGHARLTAMIELDGYAMIPGPDGKTIRVEKDDVGFYKA